VVARDLLCVAEREHEFVNCKREEWIRRAVKAEASVRIPNLIRRQKSDDDTLD